MAIKCFGRKAALLDWLLNKQEKGSLPSLKVPRFAPTSLVPVLLIGGLLASQTANAASLAFDYAINEIINYSPNPVGFGSKTPGTPYYAGGAFDTFGINLTQTCFTGTPPCNSINGTPTTVTATQGNLSFNVPFLNSPSLPDQFSISELLSPIPSGSWTFTVTNSAASNSPLIATSPTLLMITPPPFVSGIRVSGGVTPTVSWSNPPGPSFFQQVQIQDLNNSDLLLFFQSGLSGTITSYPIPQSANLQAGGKYALSINTYSCCVTSGSNNALPQAKSDLFIAPFSPLSASSEPVYLPSLSADGLYQFSVPVTANQPVLIDPPIAVGYIYQTGSSDPSITAVSFPSLPSQSAPYQISWNNDLSSATIAAGQTFTFPGAGVSEFEVRGIDSSNALDPMSSTAFVTQLTFGANGTFTGTMTAITDDTTLPSAVLPASRSVEVGGTPATAFATVINAGATAASGCAIAPVTSLSAAFTYQTTDPATNALTGSPNTPVTIASGASQSFVIAFAPTAAIAPTNVILRAGCTNETETPAQTGLNTLLLSASATPVPDIVALAASGDPGIVDISSTTGTGVFAVATVNLGADGGITATADTGSATLPVSISLCQTNPTSGNCLQSPSSSVTTTIAATATPTFGIFVAGSGSVAFSPAANRIFVRFSDGTGVTRGSTSVAVRTQ